MFLRNVGIHLPSTQCHAAEDRNTQLHLCENLKTRKTRHLSTVAAGYNDIGYRRLRAKRQILEVILF